MDKRERLRLGLVIDIVHGWVTRYNRVIDERDDVREAAQQAARTLLGRIVEVRTPGTGTDTFAVLPLEPADLPHLRALARYVRLPVMSDDDVEKLHQLPEEMPAALRDARKAVEGGGVFGRKALGEEVQEAADFVLEYGVWGRQEGLDALLDRLTPTPADEIDVALDEALSPGVGLGAILARRGTPELVDGAPFAGLSASLAALRSRTSYGESIDGALAPADALAPLAQRVTATTQEVVVCSPEGRDAADLLAQIEAVAREG